LQPESEWYRACEPWKNSDFKSMGSPVSDSCLVYCSVAEAAAQGGQPPLKPVTEVTDQEVVQQQEGSKDRTPVDKVENMNQSSSLKS
jgi:hypothetical protein